MSSVEKSVKNVIEKCVADSYAGAVTFGEVVKAFMQAGIESYHADYRLCFMN